MRKGWRIELVGGFADGSVFDVPEGLPPDHWNVPQPKTSMTYWDSLNDRSVAEPLVDTVRYRRTGRMNDSGNMVYQYVKPETEPR